MTPFVSAYAKLKTSVVAIAPNFHRGQTDFPEIIGTGFFVSEEGLVCTCKHVVDAFDTLFRPPEFRGIPAHVLIFREAEFEARRAWAWLPVEILSYGFAEVIGDASGYLGPNPPDVAFLLLNVTETPSTAFSIDSVMEGERVAFSGFPMGTRLLRAPGWLHQVGPTLHAGIVSAVLPHSLDPNPHGFIVHAQTQGGASGSPVFRDDGTVIGMVYMGIREDYVLETSGGDVAYQVPTSLTGCIPIDPIRQALASAVLKARTFKGRPAFRDVLSSATPVKMEPGTGVLEKWNGGAA